MQLRTRTWALISLLCFALAWIFWELGERRAQRHDAPPPAANQGSQPERLKELGRLNYAQSTPLFGAATNVAPADPARTNAPGKQRAAWLTNRLSNTSAALDTLMRQDQAILLRNALYDMSLEALPAIPAHLKAQGDPGACIVQARGPITDAFRAQLEAAGAKIISYVPNNAYLVRASAAVAGRLRGSGLTQAVLAWEPYYKLDLPLLALAVRQQPLGPGDRLRVVVFPGEREAGIAALQALGAEIIAQDRSPFGDQLIVQPPPASLPAIAQLASVQNIEPCQPRQLANDLVRWRLGVATNTASTTNHLGLTGAGVLVNINDTEVDDQHPDLQKRVFGPAIGTDPSGHGTHVAGTIAGDGTASASLNTASNTPPGSATNANFRGVAPAAQLYSLPVDLLLGPGISDEWLQENAAATNAVVSNNSWNYRDAYEYDSSAASYDAAVRDALPGVTGPQPMLFVFSAGNQGSGSAGGTGGAQETILSPATAKNVITVGALESPRDITNLVVFPQGTNAWVTNAAFMPNTDSSDEVAAFSSRGNVGISVEGVNGRVKPDVVTPGTFVVSCRSSDYEDQTTYVDATVNRFNNQVVAYRSTNLYQITVPDNITQMIIRTLRNRRSPKPFPALPIRARRGAIPTTTTFDYAGAGTLSFSNVAAGTWYYTVGNTNLRRPVNYDLECVLISTNDMGDYFNVLKVLNDQIAPSYRYESGTSMAAASVSGMMALMKQLFEGAPWNYSHTNSPALLKAMLINGARCMEKYSFEPQRLDIQGWGVANLTNSLPYALGEGSGSQAKWPAILIDQDPANALVTGQSHVRSLSLSAKAQRYPLRVTLVWTDPPGNPACSLKLVNDLDLIVSNRVTSEIFIGNNFGHGSEWTIPSTSTNLDTLPWDVVNNVENVYLSATTSPLDTDYDVIVRARRVNVNALTTQTNGVLQDYALVISCGNSRLTNAFTLLPTAATVVKPYDSTPFVRFLSNGVPVMNERVGANSPLLNPAPNSGVTNQWNFYVFENRTNASFTNVAVVTFLPPNLSRARVRDADIDLYVSTDPQVTNLNAAALAAARRSVSRRGTEMVLYTNAPVPTTYYIGVKSEDQQAATYAIIALATDKPFGGRDANGNIPMNFFFTPPLFIPDGSAENPNGTNALAIVFDPEALIRRLVITNWITHELGGDLVGILANDQRSVVLNNHRQFYAEDGQQRWVFDDSGEGIFLGGGFIDEPTDSPGSLYDFVGESAFGVWLYTIIDNQPGHVGTLDWLSGAIEPEDVTNALTLVRLNIRGHGWAYAGVNVPVGVTNMNVYLVDEDPPGLPLDVFIRKEDRPTLNVYDKYAQITPPGGMSLSIYDDPPLQVGRYIIGVSNLNDQAVSVTLRIEFQYGLKILETAQYIYPGDAMPLLDDAVTNSIMTVTNDRAVADVRVGVRIDHPRLSDLVLHLVSPSGTRILLAENRGGLTTVPGGVAVTNYGFGSPVTNSYSMNMIGGPSEWRTNYPVSTRSGIIRVNGDFFGMADTMHIYYEGERIFDTGLASNVVNLAVPFGPGSSTNITVVMNEGGNLQGGTRWFFNIVITGPWNYANFTDNPNLGGPLKFALPPYYSPAVDQVLQNYDFEGLVLPGQTMITFAKGNNFAGWEVLHRGIGVLANLTNAFTGTNYLALSEGHIGLPLNNITPGHDYILSFAHRKTSTSPVRATTVTVGGYDNVNWPFGWPAATFTKGSRPSPVPKLRACPGMKVLVYTNDGCLVLDSSATCGDPMGDPANLTPNGLPDRCLAGIWSSHPLNLDARTVASPPFLVGTNQYITAPTLPGDYYLFLGVNDSDFNDNGDWTTNKINVTVQWQPCQEGAAEYTLGPSAVPFTSQEYWKAETLRFTANPTTTNLQFRPEASTSNLVFRPDLNTTMLIDAVRLFEPVEGAYYLSEEPLEPLQGESAIGDWQLEILDNRAGPFTGGATNDTGVLHNWSLRFVFADNYPIVKLTNGVPCGGVVRGEETKYFMVNVPREITMATNSIVSTNVNDFELLYSITGVPNGTSPPDPIGSQASPLILDTRNPPGAELPRGWHYFLGVRNADPTTTNRFQIQVDFNRLIIPMSNGVVYPGRLAPNPNVYMAQRDDNSLAINFMDYYYFDVPSNEVASAVFELQSRDANLVVRRALPEVELFPHLLHYDYHSTETDQRTKDIIIINSNSVPVKLAAGRWYAGVYNNSAGPVDYTLTARMDTRPLYTVTPVTLNDIPLGITVEANNALTNFYLFSHHTNNAGILFEIFGLDNPDVDLVVRRSDLPSLDLHEFSCFAEFANLEAVPALTNIFLPNITATNWFIGLVNRGNRLVNLQLCIKVADQNVLTDCVAPQLNPPSGSCANGTLTLSWTVNVAPSCWEIQYKNDLDDNSSWTTYSLEKPQVIPPGNIHNVTLSNWPCNQNGFFRVVQVNCPP